MFIYYLVIITNFKGSRKETSDLITFAEEILNGKLHFCAVHRARISTVGYNTKNKITVF